MLKHPQFGEVGAFASLPPISQKSEMSSSQRQLKSFCKQLYQRHEKTSQWRGELGGHRRSLLLGGVPRKQSFVNGREMGVERLVRARQD